MGEIAVLNFRKLGLSYREEALSRKPLAGFPGEIGIKVEDLLAGKGFIHGRNGPSRFQNALQGRLKKILHDDLIPVGPANPVGGLVSKRVDPAGALETLPAVQSVRGEGTQGQLLFVPPPEETFPPVMGGQYEGGRLS